MYNISEEIAAANRKNLGILLQFAGIYAAGAEKLLDLRLKTARSAFADAARNIKAMSAVQNPQEFTALQNSMVQPAVDNFTAYARGIYAVVTETQIELNKLFEERMADMTKSVLSVLDEASESVPAGPDVAVAAVKSAIVAADQAYGAFAKTTKQVTAATVAAAGNATSGNKNNGGSRSKSA